MIPGYYRIQTRHPGGCHHCGATIPAAGIAWWRARASAIERLLCESCYVALSREAVLNRERAYQQADARRAQEVER